MDAHTHIQSGSLKDLLSVLCNKFTNIYFCNLMYKDDLVCVLLILKNQNRIRQRLEFCKAKYSDW